MTSLLKNIAAGVIIVALIVGAYLASDYYFTSKRQAEGIEAPVQIYAGDPLPEAVAAQTAKPALYACTSEKMSLYLVIADTGEFMIFDEGGAWVNNGTFFDATSDKGVRYWHAEVGNSLLGFLKKENTWHLAVVTPQESHELICL